ncbi:Raffinose permease [Enterobacter cloacae]|uniref:Raffinose permease n=1 Tax=Enterobacter cloacae TaxID=550 RepID=A0A377LQ22_ENTCL|nr:Raffinose permease [Enterobacter cloacae]
MRLNGGILFGIDPSYVFWMGSAAALLLMLLLVVAKPKPNQTAQVMNALGANQPQITAKKSLTCSVSAECGCLFCT